MSRSQGHEYQIQIFSPEGRLYQVEYAFKAVKTSNLTTVGVRGVDTVAVVTEKKVPDKLIDESSVTNIFPIADSIGAITTGIYPDCKAVVSRLRQEAGQYRFENGHYIPVDLLSARLADITQVYTQKAFMRAFGVETILCSFDEEKGPLLYKNDPSGFFCGYRAVAAGVKEQESINYLEKQFKKRKEQNKEIDYNDTIQLAIQTLQSVLSQEFKPTDIEIGVVCAKDRKFRKLTIQEIDTHLLAISNKD